MEQVVTNDFQNHIEMMCSDDPSLREIGLNNLRTLTQIYIREIVETFHETKNPHLRENLFKLLLESDLPQAQPIIQEVASGSDEQLLRFYKTLTNQHDEVRQQTIVAVHDYPTSNWRSKIGVISGFPVYWHYSLLIWIPLLVFNLIPPSVFAILFISVLIHELAHALACRYLGFGSGSITIWFYGGFFIPTDLNKLPPQMQAHERLKYIGMIVAGPISNFVLSAATYIVGLFIPAGLLRMATSINMSLAVFNLLPIPPLDGEKIVVTLGLSYLSQRRIYRALSILLLMLGVGGCYSAFAFDAPDFVIRWSPYILIGAVHAFRLSRKTDADIVKDAEKHEEAIAKEREFVKQ